jgi:hypothetical protein
MAVSGYTRLHRFEENQRKAYKPVHKLAACLCPSTVVSITQLYSILIQFTYCSYIRTQEISFSNIPRLQYFTYKPISAPPIFCKSLPCHSPIWSLCYLIKNTLYLEPQYAVVSKFFLKIFTFLFEQLKVEELIKNFPALFWVITQRVVVISYERFGTVYRSHIQGSRIQTFRIVGKELPLLTA